MKQLLAKIKNGKYYEASEKGFWRIWKNKTIWFWGLFLSSGTIFNFNSREDGDKVFPDDAVYNFFSNYWGWFLAAVLIAMIFSLITWLVSTVARAGVINELNDNQNKKSHKLGFKKIWLVGKKDFKKVLQLDLYFVGLALIILTIDLAVAIPLFFIGNKILFFILFATVFFFSLLFLILIAILKPFALVYILLSGLSIKDSFYKSWGAIKKNVREFIKLILTFFTMGIIESLAFFVVLIPFGLAGFLMYQNFFNGSLNNFLIWTLSLIGVILVIVILFIFLAVNAFFSLWRADVLIWWIKMIDGVKVKEDEKAKEINNKKEEIIKEITTGEEAVV